MQCSTVEASAAQLSRHLLSSSDPPTAPTPAPISLYYWWSKSDSILCNDRHLFFLQHLRFKIRKICLFSCFLWLCFFLCFSTIALLWSLKRAVEREQGGGGERLVIEGGKERKCGVDKLVLFCDKKRMLALWNVHFQCDGVWRTEGMKDECKAKVNKMRQKEMTKQRNEVIKK